MPVRLITAPASEPVTLDEAKAHLRLESAADDAYVEQIITAARQHVEELCWRGLVTQTWELVLEAFAGQDALELPRWTRRHFHMAEPLVLPRGNLAELPEDAPAISSVKYIDPNGVERTLESTEYTADSVSVPGRILPAYGKRWPDTRDQWDAVRVQYVVGWAAEQVPAPLRQAVLLVLAEMYERRTAEVGVMPAVVALCEPYRLNRVG